MLGQPEQWIQALGIYYLGFALFHLLFWKLFGWRWQLRSMSRINQGIVPTLNICLIFFFGLMAYLFWFWSDELLSQALGRLIILAGAGFWILRILLQLAYFPRKNKATWLFILICIAGVVMHILPLSQLNSVS